MVNDRPSAGLASSLALALVTAGDRGHVAAVVGVGDAPLVPAEAWRRVAATSTHPVAVATYDGRRRGPTRLAVETWAALPARGDEGARAFMRRYPHLVIEVPCPGDPIDIDTPDDLARHGDWR